MTSAKEAIVNDVPPELVIELENTAGTILPPVIVDGEHQYRTELYVTDEQVQARVDEMGQELAERYESLGAVHLLTVLSGAAHFASDLRRSMQRSNPALQITSDEVKVKSYGGTESGHIRVLKKPSFPLGGENVLIAEDIYDTGKTLNFLSTWCRAQGAASVEAAVAFDKDVPDRDPALLGGMVLHTGLKIDNYFVIGYGLDLSERYRDLEDVYRLHPIIPGQQA